MRNRFAAIVGGAALLTGGITIPAFGEPAPAALAGAACQPGQGVTVVVDLTYFAGPVDIRCVPGAPDRATTIDQAYKQAGFAMGVAANGWSTIVAGQDPTQISSKSYWSLYTSTANGKAGGSAATEWQYAQVGGADNGLKADEAYLYQFIPDWDEPTPEIPATLAQVLGRQGTAAVPPVSPAKPAGPANAVTAASWLGAQLAGSGDVLTLNGATDWGLTIDAMFGLVAAGVGGDQVAKTAAKLAGSGTDYVGTPAESAAKWPAVAKTVLALEVAGLDPAAFGTGAGQRNLVAELRGAMNADGSFGTGAFPLTQALAVLALARTDGGAPAQATAWLEAQQCVTAGAAGEGAFAWSDPCASPDADQTAVVLQALLAAGLPGDFGSVAAASNWLAKAQAANGGYASVYGGPNANSTGVAAQALAMADNRTGANIYSDKVAKAAGFVGTLQVTCDVVAASDELSDADLGALAFDQDGLDEAGEFGIDALNADQFQRATAQAILALGAPSFADLTAAGMAAALPARTCAPASTPPASTPPAKTDGPQNDQSSSPGLASPSASGAGSTAAGDGALAATGSGSLALAPLAGLLVACGVALVLRRSRSRSL